MPASSGRRPRRFRRALKWTGLTACMAILVTWFASRWLGVSLTLAMNSDLAILNVAVGRLTAVCGPRKPSWTGPPSGLHTTTRVVERSLREWRWDLFWALPVPGGRANSGLWLVEIPLYIPFIVLALPVAWLFYTDRAAARPGPGTCARCGYDVRGNASGVCPECGQRARPA